MLFKDSCTCACSFQWLCISIHRVLNPGKHSDAAKGAQLICLEKAHANRSEQLVEKHPDWAKQPYWILSNMRLELYFGPRTCHMSFLLSPRQGRGHAGICQGGKSKAAVLRAWPAGYRYALSTAAKGTGTLLFFVSDSLINNPNAESHLSVLKVSPEFMALQASTESYWVWKWQNTLKSTGDKWRCSCNLGN